LERIAEHTKELPKPEWKNAKRERVGSDEEAVGMQVTQCLLYPHRILVANEMGCNTNMTKDKNAGPQKFRVGKGDRAMIVAATNDAHFTTLGFTALNGELVMVVVIITKIGQLSLPKA
jgi:hypothetical protein